MQPAITLLITPPRRNQQPNNNNNRTTTTEQQQRPNNSNKHRIGCPTTSSNKNENTNQIAIMGNANPTQPNPTHTLVD
jgi:TFIIF-interacting CTD phosphatase-like protein